METKNYNIELNPQQRKAITASTGQILVLAGPGSGKTRVLTQRIAYLIQNMGVQPYRILAVTFTNKASRVMRDRLENIIGDSISDIWLGTFHASCARILRRESEFLPFTSSFVIMDADDQIALIKRCLKDLNIDNKQFRPYNLNARISNLKNQFISADNMPIRNYRDEIISRIYIRYQELLTAGNAMDFDDLLIWAIRLFDEYPQINEKYARRFEHVLVDEFQDTNFVQYRLLNQLSSHHKNLFVVGDEDQSIYRWRGADYRNILRFQKDHPKYEKILLEQNYRSTQTILDAARAVIDQNSERTSKQLFSDRGMGNKIVFYEAVDDHAEATYVVDNIQQRMGAGNGNGGKFAIMYRTNAQSRLLEEAFLRAGMPYQLVGAQRFYGRREVKDVISFLRIAQNPSDSISLLRVINLPARGIGDKTLIALQLVAEKEKMSRGDILIDLGINGEESRYWEELKGRSAIVLSDFGALLAKWTDLVKQISLPALFDQILEDTNYRLYVDDNTEEGFDRWNNVQELKKLSYEYQDRGLVEFLENLALVSDQDTLPEHLDAPTLLTLHSAKGLEFSVVYIIGLDEGLLPHSRSRDDPEEMAEERRLFYVGITRAKDQLYLIRSNQRTSYGSFEYSEPSRFLEDIPEDLIQKHGVRIRRAQRLQTEWDNTYSRWESIKQNGTISNGTEEPTRQYEPAMRVRHPSWGEGMVLESKIIDNEETVDIMFESVGFKRVLASLAKLEIIKK